MMAVGVEVKVWESDGDMVEVVMSGKPSLLERVVKRDVEVWTSACDVAEVFISGTLSLLAIAVERKAEV